MYAARPPEQRAAHMGEAAVDLKARGPALALGGVGAPHVPDEARYLTALGCSGLQQRYALSARGAATRCSLLWASIARSSTRSMPTPPQAFLSRAPSPSGASVVVASTRSITSTRAAVRSSRWFSSPRARASQSSLRTPSSAVRIRCAIAISSSRIVSCHRSSSAALRAAACSPPPPSGARARAEPQPKPESSGPPSPEIHARVRRRTHPARRRPPHPLPAPPPWRRSQGRRPGRCSPCGLLVRPARARRCPRRSSRASPSSQRRWTACVTAAASHRRARE